MKQRESRQTGSIYCWYAINQTKDKKEEDKRIRKEGEGGRQSKPFPSRILWNGWQNRVKNKFNFVNSDFKFGVFTANTFKLNRSVVLLLLLWNFTTATTVRITTVDLFETNGIMENDQGSCC